MHRNKWNQVYVVGSAIVAAERQRVSFQGIGKVVLLEYVSLRAAHLHRWRVDIMHFFFYYFSAS